MKNSQRLLGVVACLLFVPCALKFLPFPFLFIGIGATAEAIFLACSNKASARVISVNLALFFGLLTIPEAFLIYFPITQVGSIASKDIGAPTGAATGAATSAVTGAATSAATGAATDAATGAASMRNINNIGSYKTEIREYAVDDRVLGYSPRADSVVQSHLVGEDTRGEKQTLYNVQYAISQFRTRLGPSFQLHETKTPVLFFGCSYTFGEGVASDETYPEQFVHMSDGRFYALNFGFHGYGPHQTLRRLETGGEEAALEGKSPAFVIALVLPGHESRAAGDSPWDRSGPRYELNREGAAEFVGPFHPFWFTTLERQVNKSELLGLARNVVLTHPTLNRPEPKGKSLERMLAILVRADQVVQLKYKVPLWVFLWGEAKDYSENFKSMVAESRLHYVWLTESDTRLTFDDKSLRIRFDGHPNKHGHRHLAEAMWKGVTRLDAPASDRSLNQRAQGSSP